MKRFVRVFFSISFAAICVIMSGCGKQENTTQQVKRKPIEKVTLEERGIEKLNIAYLGADITYGTKEDGKSFADVLANKYDHTYIKEAVPGSLLTGTDKDGYIQRLEAMDQSITPDIFVIEIGQNDIAQGVDVGEYKEADSRDDLDTSTMTGALQYMVSYVKDTYQCEILLMSSIQYDNKAADDLEHKIWDVANNEKVKVVDLWYQLSTEIDNFASYMLDETHPNALGYEEYYNPFIESKIKELLHASFCDEINALAQYDPENVEILKNSPLEGKKIIFLGSSVTYGSNSDKVSFVEYIAKRNQAEYVKEAVSGTTLVDENEGSYISRMKKNIPQQDADLFICQLSTNDATKNLPLGKVSESKNMEDFDTSTIAGAMEYIIAYAEDNYKCPVMFYTGTKYDSELYGKMVELTYELQDKWGIGIIDMWNNLDTDIDNYDYYMANGIHPNRAGYLDWWTPFMEQEIENYLKD